MWHPDLLSHPGPQDRFGRHIVIPDVVKCVARLSFPPFSSGNLILLSHRCLRLATATSLHSRPATPAVCDPGLTRLSILLAHPLVRALAHVSVRPSVHYLPLLCVLCRLPSLRVQAWPRPHPSRASRFSFDARRFSDSSCSDSSCSQLRSLSLRRMRLQSSSIRDAVAPFASRAAALALSSLLAASAVAPMQQAGGGPLSRCRRTAGHPPAALRRRPLPTVARRSSSSRPSTRVRRTAASSSPLPWDRCDPPPISPLPRHRHTAVRTPPVLRAWADCRRPPPPLALPPAGQRGPRRAVRPARVQDERHRRGRL